MITKLDKNQFIDFLNRINITSEIDSNYLYQIYDNAIDGINEINDADFMLHVNGVNQFELINYCIGEYLYSIQLLNEEQKTKFINDENNITTIASVVVDKYLSLSMFNYQQTKLTNKYLPPVSTLNLYLNFMLNIINNVTKNDPGVTLVRDLLQKSISLSRCI